MLLVHMKMAFLMALLHFELPWMACSGCGTPQIKWKAFAGQRQTLALLYCADIGEKYVLSERSSTSYAVMSRM